MSAVAVNDYQRSLVLYSSETKCVNIVAIYILHALELQLG